MAKKKKKKVAKKKKGRMGGFPKKGGYPMAGKAVAGMMPTSRMG